MPDASSSWPSSRVSRAALEAKGEERVSLYHGEPSRPLKRLARNEGELR